MEKSNYNPILDYFKINYNPLLEEYKYKVDYNNHIITIDNKEHSCFMKTIPLVDYVKLLIGKYKKYELCVLPSKENKCNNIYEEYIHSIHNYAYVDNFFYMLSSRLSNFKHSINVYNSFIDIKENCEINIVDDFEYLCDSNYFNEQLNKSFRFKDKDIHYLFSNLKKPPIELSDEILDVEYETLDDDIQVVEEKLQEFTIDLIHEKDLSNESSDEQEDNSDTESISSQEDDDDNECSSNDEQSSDDNDEQYSNTSSVDDSIMDKLILMIDKIPCQHIMLEKCVDTMDSLFESDDINIEQLTSAIFQIVLILYVYQNVFEFTHNDLHTNNIMYVETEEEFLYYNIKGQYYKVPTFGKLYKLIDFGRSIYTYQGTRLCSDSFSSNGTANGQYNCEPFYNVRKPILEPNYSFDLCRLACSMFDFIIDDLKDIDTFRKIPIYDMIIGWVYDDHNNNILYKKNGDERYPDFKLYKMIARNVNQHIPEKQFDHIAFRSYKQDNLENFLDIDEQIKTKVLL